jgi:predicted nucleic acid-binding protein
VNPSSSKGSSRIVVDSSVMVALLVDQAAAGAWARERCRGRRLAAPALLPFEVANVLRRLSRRATLSADRITLAQRNMLDTDIELWPFAVLADRVWGLRDNLTSYDAAYCALAELAEAPLLTLDARLARATGPRCEIRVFSG